jgi:hypothetical protein
VGCLYNNNLKINADGNAYVQPKKNKGVEYIECNITIHPTGKIESYV